MRRVLSGIGSVTLRVLQVMAGVVSSLGSGGATPPTQMPGSTPRKPDEYRP
jgi:hypothetical protein